MSDTDHLEPPEGDYVRYIERLQEGRTPDLRPLAPPPDPPTPSGRNDGGRPQLFRSILDSLGAARRPAEKSREEVIARMEASARTAPAPASAQHRRRELDPALKFASSAFAMFGCMGVLIGFDEDNPAPIMFGAFAVFIAAILFFNGLRGAGAQKIRPREPGSRR